MASCDQHFTLEELGTFLKLLDEKMFASLLDQTLQVLRSTSATGIYQTATDFDPAIYKRLEGLQTTYTDEFYELGIPKDRKGLRETTTTEVPNRNQGIPDFTMMDIEIIEEPKHQSPPYTPRGKKRMTYADVAKGSSSDDFRPTSPSPEEKRNTQQTSKKGSTNNKTQQQTTKKSKLIPEKTISTVMTGYTPEDKANVHEIVIYDIPSTMPQLDILTNLGKWDQQRKERERFQAVVMDIPKSITNNVVYNTENPTQSMLSQLDGAFNIFLYNSRSIAPRKIILLPFDSSRLCNSKELLIIFLQSLDAEKLSKTFSGAVNVNQEILKC
ncbi:hypothetical protein RhiirA4_474853 [Rhizophagus irregularis]|uniref:Uncharacterized protein n=1 Tax=Rhizophagus irregularis TaxID=588596 RepID=A0A2I1H965_9GLOM|nr:hypothetical protein RhiirA4_474853 [Rhizophagus irregularis]